MLNQADLQWFVVHTKTRKESYAQGQLVRRGVATFLPWVAHTAPWRDGQVTAPLFPGYLFVHASLGEQYWDIMWSPGVRRLVGFGAAATPVDDAIMEFLKSRAGRDGFVHVQRTFHAGDQVRIARGPLAGLVGIIENPCCARGRVRVLMELLRRHTSVEVPEVILDRVAS